MARPGYIIYISSDRCSSGTLCISSIIIYIYIKFPEISGIPGFSAKFPEISEGEKKMSGNFFPENFSGKILGKCSGKYFGKNIFENIFGHKKVHRFWLFEKRCPRNPVFGGRDAGRKTFFLKDFLAKRPRFSKFSPAGQADVACGAPQA